jgi:hypothetical protein
MNYNLKAEFTIYGINGKPKVIPATSSTPWRVRQRGSKTSATLRIGTEENYVIA